MLEISVLITVSTIAFVSWIDSSKSIFIKRVLNWFPAILFAYVIPAILTHTFSLDLSNEIIHNWSKNAVMPMAIVLVMSALSFRQLRIIGIKPILIFLSGSATVAIFPILLLLFLSIFGNTFEDLLITQAFWKGIVPVVGSWIGGSTSQLVLKEVVDCEEGMFLSILLMDNVIVNIWTIIMFQLIKKSDRLNKRFKIEDPIKDFVPDQLNFQATSKIKMAGTLLICVLAVFLTYYCIDSFIYKILILSVLGLAFGNYLKFWDHTLVLKFGGFFIIMIMAILGLKLNFANFSLPLPIVFFAIIWLIAHYLVMTMVAYFFRSHMAWVPIASMANVGGISTAPAVTKAYNEEWMPHAILLAILSMVTGTTWGLLTIWTFKIVYGV